MPATPSVAGHNNKHTHIVARYEVVTQRQQRSQIVEKTAETFYMSDELISTHASCNLEF